VEVQLSNDVLDGIDQIVPSGTDVGLNEATTCHRHLRFDAGSRVSGQQPDRTIRIGCPTPGPGLFHGENGFFHALGAVQMSSQE
jgi:hypothetical protein